jgi:polysaccharide biosynthesis protein PslH
MAQFAQHFPQVPRIMEFGDLDSLKWRQYAGRSRIPLSWLYALEEKRLLAYERDIAHSFSYALVHTAAEKRDFQKLISGVPVGLVGNGVDLDYFRSAGAAKQPGSIVFTGVMDYRPNVDAVA